MPTIDLSCCNDVGIVIKQPSGVLYRNQVAGFACRHPDTEGVFCPLPVKPGKSELHALTQHFRGNWNPLTEDDAKIVDGIMRRNGHGYISVDRNQLADSYEAWVHVLLRDDDKFKHHSILAGFGNCEAILVWPNSD